MTIFEIICFERHSEILPLLIQRDYKEKTLIIYDQHPDSDVVYESANVLSSSKLVEEDVICYVKNGNYNYGNYVTVAGKLGIIKKTICYRNDFELSEVRNRLVYAFFSQRGALEENDVLVSNTDSILSFTSNNILWECPNKKLDFTHLDNPDEYIISIDLDFFDGMNLNDVIDELRDFIERARDFGICELFCSLSYQGGFVTRELRDIFLSTILSLDCASVSFVRNGELDYPKELSPYYEIMYGMQEGNDKIIQKNIQALISMKESGYSFPGLLFSLATLYHKTNALELAISSYQAALRFSNDKIPIQNDFAAVLLEANRFSEAIQFLKTCLLRHPDNISFNCNIGMAYLYTNRFSESEYYFLRSLNKNIISRQTLLGLSLLYTKTKSDKIYSIVNNSLSRIWDKDMIRLIEKIMKIK